MPCLTPNQIKVEFSMKFTSRDMSLKRTPSKKQTGVFGVKISVVTKYVPCPGPLPALPAPAGPPVCHPPAQ